jgi:hypothetical protein
MPQVSSPHLNNFSTSLLTISPTSSLSFVIFSSIFSKNASLGVSGRLPSAIFLVSFPLGGNLSRFQTFRDCGTIAGNIDVSDSSHGPGRSILYILIHQQKNTSREIGVLSTPRLVIVSMGGSGSCLWLCEGQPTKKVTFLFLCMWNKPPRPGRNSVDYSIEVSLRVLLPPTPMD